MTKNKEQLTAEPQPAGRRPALRTPWRREEAYASAGAGEASRFPAADEEARDREQLQRREAALASAKLREETLYVIDLIRVLKTHPAGRRRWAVMQAIRKDRGAAHLPIPENFEHGVESAFQQHCPESGVFNKTKGAKKPALFTWPLGKVGGVWAVDAAAAEAWLATKP